MKEYEKLKSKKPMKPSTVKFLLEKAVKELDSWENFYMEARNLDPSLEDIARKHGCETQDL